MWGVEHGVNEAGVAIGNATIYTTLDPRDAPVRRSPAWTWCASASSGRRRAADAVAEIIALLERYGQGGSGHDGVDHPYWSSFLVADPDDGWVLETSGRAWASEQVGRTRATSNRTTIFEFDAAHRHPRQPVEKLVDPRLKASHAVLAAEPVGDRDLQAHLRSHAGEDGYTVCMHAADQVTTASLIAELRGERARVLASAGSPCRSVFVPLFVGRPLGEPVAWERFAALRASHRHVLDEIERELALDADDDDAWGAEAWRRVDAALTAVWRVVPAMRIAFGTDEHTPLVDVIVDALRARGHDVVIVADGEPWPDVGRQVGESVATGDAERGVVCCWTGTGVSMAANKVAGVRAALCTDAETARGARRWNDANVLAMGLRLTSPEVAREMLDAFLSTEPDEDERDAVRKARLAARVGSGHADVHHALDAGT